MRKIISFYNILPLFVWICLSACNDDDNVDNSDFLLLRKHWKYMRQVQISNSTVTNLIRWF